MMSAWCHITDLQPKQEIHFFISSNCIEVVFLVSLGVSPTLDENMVYEYGSKSLLYVLISYEFQIGN